MWAFFNRRGLVRQWQRKTNGLTLQQIKERFHRSDINGDGNLDAKEFQRVLKQFGMTLPEEQLEILIERFDLDGDGEINMHEFLSFIESEQKNFGESPVIGTAGAAALASSLLPAKRSESPATRSRPITSSSSRGASPSPTLRGATTTPTGNSKKSSLAHTTGNSTATRPSSAPPRQPRNSRSSLSVTAPSHLQRHHVQFHDDEYEAGMDDLENVSNSRRSPEGIKATAAAVSAAEELYDFQQNSSAPVRRGTNNKLGESESILSAVKDEVDVMWMARMLQAQAEIESRLGNRYFRNS